MMSLYIFIDGLGWRISWLWVWYTYKHDADESIITHLISATLYEVSGILEYYPLPVPWI